MADTKTAPSASSTYNVATLKDALATLRGANRVYMHCRIDGYIPNDSTHYKPGYFTGAMRLTRAAAIDYLKQAFMTETDTFMCISVRLDEGVSKWDSVKLEVKPAGLIKTVWLNASA